jgi:hypothetical protein
MGHSVPLAGTEPAILWERALPAKLLMLVCGKSRRELRGQSPPPQGSALLLLVTQYRTLVPSDLADQRIELLNGVRFA